MNEYKVSLLRLNKLWVQNCKYDENNPIPIKLISLLGQFGYSLSDKFLGLISGEMEKKIIKSLLPIFQDVFSGGKSFKTVWLTPQDLPETREEEILIQEGLYSDPSSLKEHEPSLWNVNNWKIDKILEPGYDLDIKNLISSLLTSKSVLGESDMEILKWALEERGDLVEEPESIPVKETLSLVLSRGFCKNCISGVTDILRTVYYLSNLPTSLNKVGKIKLTKKNKKIVLDLLEEYLEKQEMWKCLQDAKKYKEVWKIVLYQLRPRFSTRSEEFAKEIRSNSKTMIKGWNSHLQKAYDNKDYDEVIRLLLQRPAEFIRKYDSLIRKSIEDQDMKRFDMIQDALINKMDEKSISKKVIFELCRFYEYRNDRKDRSYIDKSGQRYIYDESSLKPLPDEIISVAQSSCLMSIINFWKKQSTFKDKKVYLDLDNSLDFNPSFRGCTIDMTEFMFPGQIIKFPLKGCIRFFSQWEDEWGNEDLDLHAKLIDSNGKLVKSINWIDGFADEGKVITHSGDVRFQKGDCSEYVTIDYESPRLNLPSDWLLITIQNYECRPLNSLKNWIGISSVTDGHFDKNDNWIPPESDTLFRGRVTSESKNLVAFLVNIKEGWAKLILEGINVSVLNNAEVNSIKHYLLPNSIFNVKTLMEFYVKSTGGTIVEEPDEDTIILGKKELVSGELHNYLLG